MTLKTTKRLLTLASLFVLTAAGAVVVWGFQQTAAIEIVETADPKATATGQARSGLFKKTVSTDRSSPILGSDNFASLWERPLRRPLFDPPPPPPRVAERKVPPPIRAHLLATMIEPENSTAILRLASGEVVFRKVGQSLGTDEPNAKIARIEAGSVSVSRDGDETRLLVDGQKSR
jgi:hypothetical protein